MVSAEKHYSMDRAVMVPPEDCMELVDLVRRMRPHLEGSLVDILGIYGQYAAFESGLCGRRCHHGSICSLKVGHDGWHMAEVTGKPVRCEWSESL